MGGGWFDDLRSDGWFDGLRGGGWFDDGTSGGWFDGWLVVVVVMGGHGGGHGVKGAKKEMI